IAVSEATARNSYVARYPEKLVTIPNGVELPAETRPPSDTREDLGVGDRILATIVARVDGWKGHNTLIRSMVRVKESGAPVTALIVGDGHDRTRLGTETHELGLGSEDVRFLGFRFDVPDLLAASDMFVLPS